MNKKYRIDLETNGSGRVLRVKVWWPGEIQPTHLTDEIANGTIEDVFSFLGEKINSEDDEIQERLSETVLLDWNRRTGWRVHCSEHGSLRVPPQGDEENEYDLTVISAWEHLWLAHEVRPAVNTHDLINPDRWADAIARLRSL